MIEDPVSNPAGSQRQLLLQEESKGSVTEEVEEDDDGAARVGLGLQPPEEDAEAQRVIDDDFPAETFEYENPEIK